MCEFSEYGFEAEWGDYIRRHAMLLVRHLGMGIGAAIATVKVNIARGVAPENLAEQIISRQQRNV